MASISAESGTMIQNVRAGDAKRTAAVVLAGFCAFLDLYAPQPLLPNLAQAFHKTPAVISQAITVSTLAVALAAPFVGVLSDRLGRKNVIVPASLLLAIPTLLTAFSHTFSELLVCRFLQGLLIPGIFVATLAYISEEWEQGAGSAVAAYVTGTVLGGFCGRTLSAVVTEVANWHAAFLLLAILNLAGGFAIWAWLPSAKTKLKRTDSGISELSQMLAHLRNPRLLATYCAGFCVLFSLVAMFTYVNFYLDAPPFSFGTTALGLLFVVYLVGAVINPVAGKWIDRVGHKTTFSAALSVCTVGGLMTLTHSAPLVIGGLAVFCTGVFIAQSSATSYVGVIATEAKASAIGLYVMFYYLGGSVGAYLPGHFWGLGGWPACVLLVIFAQLGTIAVAQRCWEPLRAFGVAVSGETQ
jgi:predicted MFS family arabinose efflux permease